MGRHGARYERAAFAVSLALLVLLFALVLIDVVFRSVRVEFYWGNEGGSILMAWMIFLALPLVGRRGMHIRTDFVAAHLPAGLRRALDIAGQVLMLAYMVLLAWLCFELTRRNFANDARSQGILRLPLYVEQTGIVVGLLLMVVSQVRVLLRAIVAARDGEGAPP